MIDRLFFSILLVALGALTASSIAQWPGSPGSTAKGQAARPAIQPGVPMSSAGPAVIELQRVLIERPRPLALADRADPGATLR